MKKLIPCIVTLCLTFSCATIQNYFQEMEQKAKAEKEAEIAEQKAVEAITIDLQTEKERYQSIDEWAVNTPDEVEKDPDSLAAYLQEKAVTDWEKTRAVFTWVGDNIEYDIEAFLSSGKTTLSADDVLKSRKSVCEGFSNMFEQLAGRMGLKAVKISGYSKGYGYKAGSKFKKTDHAWNAVYLDKSWHLFDSTWGGGYIDSGTNKYIKKLESFWFDVSPEEMIYTHLPEDPKWQLLPRQVSLAAFEKMPFLHEGFFKLGVSVRELSMVESAPDASGFCKIFDIKDACMRKIALPLDNILRSDKEYEFKFVSPNILEMAFINNGKFTKFTRRDTLYKKKIKPDPGVLQIGATIGWNANQYWIIAEYKVL